MTIAFGVEHRWAVRGQDPGGITLLSIRQPDATGEVRLKADTTEIGATTAARALILRSLEA